MSMELMVKVMKIKVGNPLRKLVLLKLADNASDTGECWPSYKHIADQCEISRRSVIEHIKQLNNNGFLEIQRRKSMRSNKVNATNLFILHLDGKSEFYELDGSAVNSLGGGAGSALGGAGAALGGGAGAAPRTSNSLEPVIEPKKNTKKNIDLDLGKKSESSHKKIQTIQNDKISDEFSKLWEIYPNRAGGNSRAGALKCYRALRKKYEFDEIQAGLTRYARYCDATNITGTQFVKQAKTFFGTDLHWQDAYKLPLGKQNGQNNKPESNFQRETRLINEAAAKLFNNT